MRNTEPVNSGFYPQIPYSLVKCKPDQLTSKEKMSRAKKPHDCILQDYLCLWWGQPTVSSCEWLKKTVVRNASPSKLQYHVAFRACNRHLLLNIKKQGERYACVLRHFSCVWLFVTLWTVAHQAPLSMGLSRQATPGDFPQPGIKLMSPALQVESLLLSHRRSPGERYTNLINRKSFPPYYPTRKCSTNIQEPDA